MASNDEGDISCLMPIEERSAAIEDFIGSPALPMDRYYLWDFTFCGEKDVEQFIAEFSDVTAICKWPARVALIQRWLCLTGSAKPHGIGQDVGSIFEALGARFANSKGLGEILRHPCENTRS